MGVSALPPEPNEVKDVRQQVNDLVALRSRLSDEVATLKAEASKISFEIHQAKTKADLTLQKSAEAAEAILAHAKKLERDAQLEVEKQQGITNAVQDDWHTIRGLRTDLETRHKTLKTRLESVEKRESEALQAIEANRALAASLDAREVGYVAREEHIQALSRIINDKTLALNAKEQVLLQREATVQANMKNYEAKDQTLTAQERRVQIAHEQLSQDVRSFNTLKAEVDDKQKKLLILDGDIKRQQKALTERNNRLNEYSLTLDLKERQLRRVAKMHGFEQKLDELMKQEAAEEKLNV